MPRQPTKPSPIKSTQIKIGVTDSRPSGSDDYDLHVDYRMAVVLYPDAVPQPEKLRPSLRSETTADKLDDIF